MFTTLGIFNAYGVYSGFYERIVWYDIPMHALGGMSVFLGMLLLVQRAYAHHVSSVTLLRALGVVIIVGVLWEYYELLIGAMSIDQVGYYADTAHDIGMDLLGGIIGFGLIEGCKQF
jgi:hypothetical protein